MLFRAHVFDVVWTLRSGSCARVPRLFRAGSRADRASELSEDSRRCRAEQGVGGVRGGGRGAVLCDAAQDVCASDARPDLHVHLHRRDAAQDDCRRPRAPPQGLPPRLVEHTRHGHRRHRLGHFLRGSWRRCSEHQVPACDPGTCPLSLECSPAMSGPDRDHAATRHYGLSA
eukprot:609886-Rhodomonas_salina.1